MHNFFNSIHWMKAIKIAIGAVAAILLAQLIGLENAASAGIITLLTVQNTRRATIAGSLRRLAGFGILTLLCAPIYGALGAAPWTFGLVVLLLLLLCFGLHLEDSTPINAVIATHYMAAGGVTLWMFGNELLLLTLGSGIGLVVNWIMPDNLQKIRQSQTQLDQSIRTTLRRISAQLLGEAGQSPAESLAQAEDHSKALREEVDLFLENQTRRQELYFLHYVTMRRTQCVVLGRILEQLSRITALPKQAQPLAALFQQIAEEYHEENDCQDLLSQLEQLHQAYCCDSLPERREEFENRAILYCVLTEIRAFLRLKQNFYQEREKIEKRD